MIATAEVLNEPTHTTEPRFNFLADHLLSDLHADNALCILKTRIRGPRKFPEMFSTSYEGVPFLLAADIQGLASRIKVRLAFGPMKDQILALDKDHVIIIQHGGFGQGDAPTVALLDLSALQHERKEFFTHGLGVLVDEPLIIHTENPTTKEIKSDYYLSDALGSITELVGKEGAITGEIVYNSYGKFVHSSGNAMDQCYSYTGREFEKESGLYYYRVRFYDPQIGRFLQKDPIPIDKTDPMSLVSLYLYTSNNPVKFIDPLGTIEFTANGLAVTTLIVGKVVGYGGLLSTAAAFWGASKIRQHIVAINNNIFKLKDELQDKIATGDWSTLQAVQAEIAKMELIRNDLSNQWITLILTGIGSGVGSSLSLGFEFLLWRGSVLRGFASEEVLLTEIYRGLMAQ